MSAQMEKPRGPVVAGLTPAVAGGGVPVVARQSAAAAKAGTPASRAKVRRTSLHRQRQWAMWGSYAALTVFVVMFLMPPFYTLMTSLKSSAEISAQVGSPWLVKHPTLENFWYLITYPNFQTYYLNSVMITVLTVAVSMIISVLAAFSLARMGFWGSNILSTGVFLTYLIRRRCCSFHCSRSLVGLA